MNEPRGGQARWCADCGAVLAVGQVECHACGLDSTSPIARDTERANGELHRLRAQLSQLTEQQNTWLKYRKEVLAFARRGAVDLSAPLAAPPLDAPPLAAPPVVGEAEVCAVPDGAVEINPFAGPADVARAPHAPPTPQSIPAPGAGSRSSAPTAQMFQPPTPYSPVRPTREPVKVQADAMRPAKRLTAPVLLGVAGAALFILAGIVFVAASWSTTGPVVRMVILIAFAAVFAWLARMATRHDFTAVGGALGVVSAAFVGVGVYALTAGPSGVAPYTTAIAVFVAACAGLGLTRLKIKAVGEVASAAIIFAVQAGAVEGAWRSSDLTVAMSTYVIVATLGGGVVVAARTIWRSIGQRATATYGGMATVFLAALMAVLAPLSAHSVDGLALIALLLSIGVCAGIAAWRPAWGAGVLAGLVSIGAVTAASMWKLTGGQLAVVFAIAAVFVVVGLGRAPLPWRKPGLLGLLPGLTGLALAMFLPAIDGIPRAFAGVGLFGDWSISTVGGLSWFGAALVLVAALPLVSARWAPPALVNTVWVQGAAAVSFALGTVFVGLDTAHVAAQGAAAAGLGLALAAVLQWFAAPLWGARHVAMMRSLATVLTTVGGLHGAAAIVESVYSQAQFVWGSVALVVALVALAGAAIRQRYAAGGSSLVAVVGAGALTWHFSGSIGAVVVAAALAALLVAVVGTRLPTTYVSPVLMGCLPAYISTVIGIASGVFAAAAASLGEHSAGAFPGYSWAFILSGCVAISGPVLARLADRIGVESPARVTRVVTGIGVVALALSVLARAQQALADAGPAAVTAADACAPAIAVGVGAAAYALVALVPWWRPARIFVGIGVVVLISIHGLVELWRLTTGNTDLWWAISSVLFAAAALALAARWFPRVTLAPAIGLASLVAPAALAPHQGEISLAAAAVVAAVIAWVAGGSRGVIRAAALFGGIGVMLVAAGAGLNVAGAAFGALFRTWGGDDVGWRPWMLVVTVAVTIALLAWQPTRKVAGIAVAVALAAMAGLVPAPVGWVALAVIGVASTEASARWRSRLGLHPLVPLAVGISAVAWSVGAASTVAVALGMLSLASIWTAIRATQGGIRAVAMVLAPIAGAIAVFLALHSWNVDLGVAASVAAGTALTMPLIAAAAGLDSRRVVTIWLLVFTSVLGPFLTGDLGLAGLVVVLACAAWFALSTMGVPRARWLALGGLSVAAMLIAADVGIATLEVYTAVPALSMILVGLWWLKRAPHIRTYFALAPGLGAALVPSYIALVIHPGVLVRTLSLVGAALILAVVGVARRWFAPLLATAVTAVVVALSQATAGDPVLPLWFSVSIIGAVLFALAILAERIKAMR